MIGYASGKRGLFEANIDGASNFEKPELMIGYAQGKPCGFRYNPTAGQQTLNPCATKAKEKGTSGRERQPLHGFTFIYILFHYCCSGGHDPSIVI